MSAAPRPLVELIDPGWAQALEPVAADIAAMGDFLRAETAAGRRYLPSGENVLRAFQAPFADVRVLIVGQDPYPTPGHPIGLSFAVDRSVRPVPRSLQNIYKELQADLGVAPPAHGDLTAWTEQGVLLLNRALTVQAGASGSHRGKGWEPVTEAAIRALVARSIHGRPAPLVAILWGRDAGTLRPLLGATPVIASAHPSPLSASSGFFGSRPFSRANELLVAAGGEPVDWTLPGSRGIHRLVDVLEEEYNPPRKLPPHLKPAPPEAPRFEYSIRDAEPRDIPDMRELYNHYVANSTVTFDEDALTLAEMRKKYQRVADLGYPWLIAVSPSGNVLGYAYVTPWNSKAAYRYTVENSIYLGPASTGKGLGGALMTELLARAKAAGIKEIVAVIADSGADASIRLHERFGFKEVGRMGRVGFKFGRWLGTVQMQKSLK